MAQVVGVQVPPSTFITIKITIKVAIIIAIGFQDCCDGSYRARIPKFRANEADL